MRDPRVGAELQNFIAVRYDADQPLGQRLSQRYRVGGFPGFVVIDGSGNVVGEFAGYRTAAEFVNRLRALRRA